MQLAALSAFRELCVGGHGGQPEVADGTTMVNVLRGISSFCNRAWWDTAKLCIQLPGIGEVLAESIRAAGFDRLNLDLMYGFKGQSPQSWQHTLQHAIDLDPEYITLYRMRYKLTRISHQAPDVHLPQVRTLARQAKELLLGVVSRAPAHAAACRS